MGYTTDLTAAQYEVLEKLLPKSKTRGYVINRHEVVNAMIYQLKNGCQWRDLPNDFPKWQTVYSQFRRWKLDGVWDEVLAELAAQERKQRKKKSTQACS
jgi:transposase